MTQLRKRVEGLEKRLIPPMLPTEFHIVGMEDDVTEAEALARYGRPIGPDDHIVFLVGRKPRHAEA